MSKPVAIVTGASSGIGLEGGVTAMAWIRDRALTLALMAMFLLSLGGQLLTGFAEYNSEQTQHGHTAVALTDYLAKRVPGDRLDGLEPCTFDSDGRRSQNQCMRRTRKQGV